MPSLWSAFAAVGELPDNTALRSTGFRVAGRSVIVLSLLPFAAARAGHAPFAQRIKQGAGPAPFAPKIKQRRGDQSLFSPCCHLRRCSPNQETMIAASRNGIMALEIAAPSPSWPAMIAR